jgi:cytochrome o ubiquinol oxidase operon protein cyoD
MTGHDAHGQDWDRAPGEEYINGLGMGQAFALYGVGLFLAVLLTAVSFYISGTGIVWKPSIPVALVVLAIAQMGIHVVFFLHITTGPENTNNVMALGFGILIVLLIVVGSVWIMNHMNHSMLPMQQIMQMQR